MDWMGLYEKLVNTDTGFDLSIEEKLDSTEFLREILEDLGFEVRRGRASHIAKMGDPPYVTLIGHLDTVFPRGEPERRPFRVEGDIVKGPGVADMKGGAVILLKAIEDYLRIGKKLSLAVVLNVDEEIGSPEGRLDHYEMAENSRFVLSFETGRKDGDVVIGRKGIASLKLKVIGRSGHASVPQSGINALLEMAHKILKIHSLGEGDLTVTPTICRSGYKINVIPDEAEAQFDIRYSDPDQISSLRIKLEDVFHEHAVDGTVFSYSLEVNRPPMKTLQRALEVLEELKERLNLGIKGLFVPGGGDAAFYTEKGVPAIDGLGIVGRYIHSPEEEAYLSTFENRVRLTLEILKILENL